MRKSAKGFKAMILAGVLAVTSLGAAFSGDNTLEAEAASQFSGNYYGVGFDSDESTMHKADGWSNGGMFNCTWRASNVWFSDGKMNLKIDKDSNGGYSGGEYRTNQTFGYGMYDVSLKAIKNDGVVTSFFTYTGPTDGTVWDEIDIEILGKDTTKVQFNYFTNGVGGHEYVYDLGFDASKGFHQYGFLWLPDRITWYVDGKEVYTATKDIPSTPGKIMMNVWPGIGVDSWLKAYNGKTPLVAQYDWASFTKVDYGQGSGSSSSGFNSSTRYKIISKKSGKALDVAWGDSANGANILQYQYEGNPNQKWYLEPTGDGYYVIKSAKTGKVVDVEGNSKSNGANVLQWSYNGGKNQQWKIEHVKDGYYSIISRSSGKGLDVEKASTANNANVLQWNYSGKDNQLWKIEPAN